MQYYLSFMGEMGADRDYIDSDVQLTLHKAFEKLEPDTWEIKTLKAISLLEMNGEQLPVTALF